MAPEKTFGPSTILTFAGVELGTIRCESRLPEDKLLKCKQLIAEFIKKKKATLRELQSLTGVLILLFNGCSRPLLFTMAY